MTDWIAHNVGGCPVSHNVNVIVKYGSGERKTGMAGFFDWTIAGGKCGAVADIIEYQIVDAAPASTDWIEWHGGECPVEDGTLVDVRHRDGDEFFGELAWGVEPPNGRNTKWAGQTFWNNDGMSGDIVAYRLVDAPGASTESALSAHPGGTHYSGAAIQPAQFITANRLQFLEGCIVKRAFRHDKPTGKGREDVEKIIHEAQLLLELKYGVAA